MPIINRILNLPLPILNHWGYWLILLFAMSEAIPLFGLFVPGMVVVVIGGFLAKIGILEIGDVIFFASVGAIIGDLIGYFLGKKYGDSFLSKYGKYFFFRKKYFEETKKLMDHHTGKALIIGRFNSLTRAFAPFIAGSTNVSFLKFIIYNIVGGISWALTLTAIGYIFGRGYEIALNYIKDFSLIAILLGGIIIYILIKTKNLSCKNLSKN